MTLIGGASSGLPTKACPGVTSTPPSDDIESKSNVRQLYDAFNLYEDGVQVFMGKMMWS